MLFSLACFARVSCLFHFRAAQYPRRCGEMAWPDLLSFGS